MTVIPYVIFATFPHGERKTHRVSVEVEPYPFHDPVLAARIPSYAAQPTTHKNRRVWIAKSSDGFWSRPRYWLLYAENVNRVHHEPTGPFSSRIKAIEFYATGGR